jgi:ATP-GRASP peptide maturase of grasp-with-spasm system
MILLLSSSDDVNLDYVMDWLRFYRHPFLRINADQLPQDDFHLSLTPPRFTLRGREIDLAAIGAVWVRKSGNFRRSNFCKEAQPRMSREALNQLAREYTATIQAFTAVLGNKHWLTHPSKVEVNKLEMLLEAQKCGLAIPETHILNRKADLARLVQEGEYISKSSYEMMFLKEPGGSYSMFTTGVGLDEVESFDEEFFPSLVQKKVDKEYELRLFYLDGECYTMAIFSQQQSQTKLDFREDDWTNPTRSVPYELPPEVADGVRRFMTAIGLNCGSVDMIKGTDGRYYFLEVNPTGQFGMTSIPCNYSLFEKIAEYLIRHDRPQEEARG